MAHVTLISSDDETKARIRRYNCMVVLVNLCGIVIFKSGPGQNAALKVEIATGLLICCFQTLREVRGGGYPKSDGWSSNCSEDSDVMVEEVSSKQGNVCSYKLIN